jgi:hypothetical protein
MSPSKDEPDRRLAGADRARLTLRRASLEWRELGDRVLAPRAPRAARGLETVASPGRRP